MSKKNPENASLPMAGESPGGSPTSLVPDEEIDPGTGERDSSLNEIESRLKTELLDGGTIRITRRGPMDALYAYVTKMDIRAFEIESIKKIYGGGDYKCQTFRKNGQMGPQVNFSVDARFRGVVDPDRSDGNGNGKAVDPVALMKSAKDLMGGDTAERSSHMSQIMKMQADNTSMMMTLMMESSKQQMAMMAGMMTAMSQAMANKSSVQSGFGMQDVIGLLTLIKSGEGKTDLVQLIQAVKELKGVTDGAGEETAKTWPEKIMEALPHAASIVESLRGGGKPAPQVTAAPQLKSLPPPTAGASVPSEASVKQGLGMIIMAAKNNRDVELYHDMILELVSDDQLPMLQAALTGESWFVQFFGTFPEAESVRPWLTKLRDLLLVTLNQPADESDSNANDKNTAGLRPAEGAAPAG